VKLLSFSEELAMRSALAVVFLLGATALTGAQPVPPAREPGEVVLVKRYGVNPRIKAYPQDAPKVALKSALLAIEKADYPYLVAQLLEPKFVDETVRERAKQFEAGAETELTQLRDFQRANPGKIADEDRVPLDPRAFRAMVDERARDRGFKLLVREVEQKLSDDPQVVKEFRRIAREGSFADADPNASATHPDLKGRSLYFKKIGGRWFLENRQTEEKKEP
jgi:hypothetical protein